MKKHWSIFFFMAFAILLLIAEELIAAEDSGANRTVRLSTLTPTVTSTAGWWEQVATWTPASTFTPTPTRTGRQP